MVVTSTFPWWESIAATHPQITTWKVRHWSKASARELLHIF